MPRSIDSGLPQRGHGSPGATVDDVGPHVDVEVATEHRIAHVMVDTIRAGDPRRVRRCTLGSATTTLASGEVRADVALRELGMRGEVVVAVEPHALRRERGRERELVDLAIAGNDREPELTVDVERDRLQQRRRLDVQELGDTGDARHVRACAPLPSAARRRRRGASPASTAPRRAASTFAA